MKKGQIMLYVVIAILIIFAAGIVIYIQSAQIGNLAPPINGGIRPINTFIESCIKNTAENALVFIGQQGGYYDLPYNSDGSYIYYFAANKSYFPKEETVEQQLSLYMDEMIPFCTKNFVDFSDFQTDADPAAIKTTTTILEYQVKFDVEWPILMKRADLSYNLNEFSIEIPSRLNTVYNVAGNMISEQLKNPSSICLSCMTNLAIENNLYIDMENYGNDSVIFTITDNKTLINNQPYDFVFANKY